MRRIPTDVRASVRALVEYLWTEEEKHWHACGCPSNHIFRHVERVSAWLNRKA